MAEEIGFNVRVLEASRKTSMKKGFELVHTSHVVMGVHGAGLTHFERVSVGASGANRDKVGFKDIF